MYSAVSKCEEYILAASRELMCDFMCVQYSMWLDQHNMEEALRFIRSALEACAAAAEKEAGFNEVYPVMLQIAKGSTR